MRERKATREKWVNEKLYTPKQGKKPKQMLKIYSIMRVCVWMCLAEVLQVEICECL